MPQNDAGMFETLGLNPVEDPMLREKNRENDNRQGVRGGQALGMLVRGLINKRKGGKFNPSEVMENFRNDRKAENMGLQGGHEELASINKIRDAAAKQDFGDVRTSESRIRMAEFVAEQAKQQGNTPVRARAMAQIQALRKEQTEERKNKAQADRAEHDANRAEDMARDEATPDIWLKGEGQARAAQRAEWTNENGKPVAGMEYVDDEGKIVQVPVGQYSTQDPSVAARNRRANAEKPRDTIGTAWGRNTSPQDYRKINNMVTTTLAATRTMGRVMDTIVDLTGSGRVTGVMGAVGKGSVTLTEAVRGLNSVGHTLQRAYPEIAERFTKDMSAEEQRLNKDGSMGTWSGKEGIANDENHALWDILPLPEAIRGDAALAQNYRAQMMELMYMTARLAEPSNRGLSDNDILNAARRLGGDTSNPAVMMARFAEMLYDGVADIEGHLDTWWGAVAEEDFHVPEGMTKRQMFERFVGGDSMPIIRGRLKDMEEKYDFSVDSETGRSTWGDPLDDFVNPGETEDLSRGRSESAPVEEEQSDEDFLGEF